MCLSFAWDHKNEILNKEKNFKVNGFHMLKYKNRIVFTGGTGRFAKVFKSKQNKTKLTFYFPKKNHLNILKTNSIKKYLKKIKPKYLIHLAGL